MEDLDAKAGRQLDNIDEAYRAGRMTFDDAQEEQALVLAEYLERVGEEG